MSAIPTTFAKVLELMRIPNDIYTMLLLLAEGMDHREIVKETGWEDTYTRSVRQRAIVYMGAKNTTNAVALAFHRGILKCKHVNS